MRTFAAAALGVVAVVVAALAARDADDEVRTAGRTQPPSAAPEPMRDAAPGRATGQLAPALPSPPRADAAAPSTLLELPDGSYVDALNGAVDAPPMRDFWGPFAWSPIVGVERSDAGIDWYRHADGSYSTTQMVLREDLGRMAAMTRVAHPGAAPAAAAAAPRAR